MWKEEIERRKGGGRGRKKEKWITRGKGNIGRKAVGRRR